VASEFLMLLEKIPSALWVVVGAAISALSALIAVLITNRASDRRLRAQLDHDRILKNRDRELFLRKDVYLAAAEAISVGLTTVSKFSDLSIPHDKLTERFVERSAAITKVHVIAKEETAKALTNFTSELGATYLRLFAKRYPLVEEKGYLDIIKEQIDSFGKERDRTLELMKQHNLEGKTDQRKWEVLQHTFDFEKERVSRALEEHKKLASTLWTKQVEYAKECLTESAKLGRLLVPLLAAVRSELDLPINETEYAQIIEKSLEKQQIDFGEFLESVKSSRHKSE